ncbi:hypothetical protein V8F20_010344 [Naviculisporaceae sp. PSN 640]
MSSSTYSRSESSRSYKHSSGKDSKHRRHHSSKSTAPVPGNDLRFLFVVNEVTFNRNFNQRFPVDSWLNEIPPSAVEAYGPEIVGPVFQYDCGRVSLAQEYYWYRQGAGFAGGIARHGANGSSHFMLAYKTATVFSCSPHLPIIVSECDVSCEPTFVFHNAPLGGVEPARWNILSFIKQRGFSQVNAEARDSPYVLGGNPSWIPALVPKVYQNHEENAPRSTGLGGDLATIIGLMAFHGERERASEVFLAGNWQQNRWHGSPRAPNGYPKTPHDPPRGFVVHIALNIPADDVDEATADAYKNDFELLEWNTVFVRE